MMLNAFNNIMIQAQGTQELFVTLIVDCSQILQLNTMHHLCFCTVESSKPSLIDPLINLVKYYPMLRKFAEGNDCRRITATNIRTENVSLFGRLSLPRSIRSYFTTQPGL